MNKQLITYKLLLPVQTTWTTSVHAQSILPVWIMVTAVDADSLVFASMMLQVTDAVVFESENPKLQGALYRLFTYSGEDPFPKEAFAFRKTGIQ